MSFKRLRTLAFVAALSLLSGCAHRATLTVASSAATEVIPNARVHFSTGAASLGRREREKVVQNAVWLARNPGARIVLEGHCDERGSRDFNMKLGDGRARAVKAALVKEGAPDAGRIVVISMGEDAPLVSGRSEKAFRMNRRVDFIAQ